MSGFRELGHIVSECRVDPRKMTGLRKYWKLIKEYWRVDKKVDVVIVAFPGHTVVWLARLLWWRKPIIFDAFLSLFDSNVYDRSLYGRWSIQGMKDWFLDWSSSLLATKVLLDTDGHREYFNRAFGVSMEKMVRVFIGADSQVFRPIGREAPPFIVHFHGNFIPLQGIDYLIQAAILLKNHEDISFRIVGDGKRRGEYQRQLEQAGARNVVFVGKVPMDELPRYIAEVSLCIGIVGDTGKTQRVIPNKVYECIAMRKPVLTADTPAIRELFADQENIFLCTAADPQDLARKILLLRSNTDKREEVAQKGYELFQERLTPRAIVERLLSDIL